MSSAEENGPLREPEVIDGATGKPLPPLPRKRFNLSSNGGVRREMARVYKSEENGEIDTERAKSKIWMLDRIGERITADEMEQEIHELRLLVESKLLPGPA